MGNRGTYASIEIESRASRGDSFLNPDENAILEAIAAQHGKPSEGYRTPFAFGAYPDARQRWKCGKCGTVFSSMFSEKEEAEYHGLMERYPDSGGGMVGKLRSLALEATAMEDTIMDNAWAMGKWATMLDKEIERLA